MPQQLTPKFATIKMTSIPGGAAGGGYINVVFAHVTGYGNTDNGSVDTNEIYTTSPQPYTSITDVSFNAFKTKFEQYLSAKKPS
jgi:hypothetical protein